MSENEGGESKFMTGFLVGFLVGVLICLGVGGTFAVVYGQRESLRARAAMEEAVMAREMAEVARVSAQEAERKAAAEKAKGEGKDKGKEQVLSKEREARIKIRNLEMAVGAYKINHGEFPESLEILTEPIDGKPAFVEVDAILDPWKRRFLYTPDTRSPKTGYPLIYSAGANPGESAPIRNWEAEKAK